MSHVALYTFGLLHPDPEPAMWADFEERGGAIFGASERAPGFLGRAAKDTGGADPYRPGTDHGAWGVYVLPDLPSFAGHDRQVHIATLSLWRDVPSARSFAYGGRHRVALQRRHDWFVKGPWPGHVLWWVPEGAVPQWAEGVTRLEALAAHGEAPDRFTFRSAAPTGSTAPTGSGDAAP